MTEKTKTENQIYVGCHPYIIKRSDFLTELKDLQSIKAVEIRILPGAPDIILLKTTNERI